MFFSDFSKFFLGVYEDFFEWTTPPDEFPFSCLSFPVLGAIDEPSVVLYEPTTNPSLMQSYPGNDQYSTRLLRRPNRSSCVVSFSFAFCVDLLWPIFLSSFFGRIFLWGQDVTLIYGLQYSAAIVDEFPPFSSLRVTNDWIIHKTIQTFVTFYLMCSVTIRDDRTGTTIRFALYWRRWRPRNSQSCPWHSFRESGTTIRHRVLN